jgi:hypothetical protein
MLINTYILEKVFNETTMTKAPEEAFKEVFKLRKVKIINFNWIAVYVPKENYGIHSWEMPKRKKTVVY